MPLSPADTVTLVNMENYLAYVHEDTMLWYMLGWTGAEEPFQFPILGGTGNPINPEDPSSFSVNPITGDTTASGTVVTNNGYLFDPAGADGIPFSGDEPLAPTGYFFTYNYLEGSTSIPYGFR